MASEKLSPIKYKAVTGMRSVDIDDLVARGPDGTVSYDRDAVISRILSSPDHISYFYVLAGGQNVIKQEEK